MYICVYYAITRRITCTRFPRWRANIDNDRYTLIDYFICSPELTDSSVAGHILDDEEYNTSDHLAITCEFVTAGAWVKSTMPKNNCLPRKLLWEMANLDSYQPTLRDVGLLLPSDALLFCDTLS